MVAILFSMVELFRVRVIDWVQHGVNELGDGRRSAHSDIVVFIIIKNVYARPNKLPSDTRLLN